MTSDFRYPLTQRLPLESLIGLTAGFTVAPFVAMVDKAIIQSSAGQSTLLNSLATSGKLLAFKPLSFLKTPEALWLWFVYASTYATANSVDAFCKQSGIPHEMPKLLIVFGVNMSASIAKDRALVRIYGSVKGAAVPLPSYCYWGIRDCFTVTFAFIAPSRITSYLVNTFSFEKNKTEAAVTFSCPILL